MFVRSSRVCTDLLCFTAFICALSGISRGNDSLNGFTLSSERNTARLPNVYQEKPHNEPRLAAYTPFLNSGSRSTFERHDRSNLFGYSNLMSQSKPKLLRFGRKYPLLNHKLSSASTGEVYGNWSKYLPRSDRTQPPPPQYAKIKSYIPLVRPKSYHYKVAPLSTRPAESWRWGQYADVNAFPRTMGYGISPRYQSFRPWQQRSSVSRPPVAAPLSAGYLNYPIRGRMIYPADRVERDSVLNMRSGNVIPWGQEEATERNLHVERPMDQAAFPRRVRPSYSINQVPYWQGALATRARTRSLGADFARWKQVPIASNTMFNDKAYPKEFNSQLREDHTRSYPVPQGQLSNTRQRKTFTHLTVPRKEVSKGYIPHPNSSEKLSRLRYVLQLLRKRNARFATVPASFSKPITNAKDKIARTRRKSKRSSGCRKCTFHNKRFSNLAAKKRSSNHRSPSFKSRRKRGLRKWQDVRLNTKGRVKKRQDIDSTQINQFEPLSRFRLVNDFQEQSQVTRPPPLAGTVYGTDVTSRNPVFVPKVADFSDDPEVKNVLLVPSASPGVKFPPALPGLKRYLKNHKTKKPLI